MPDERSPVFIQCLDALYQIMQQFPHHFEYTTDLLVFIADHLNSGMCDKQSIHYMELSTCMTHILSRVVWKFSGKF